MTEADFHHAVADYFRACLAPEVLWWHTPNNPRDAKHGAWLQQLGMRAGVPDFILIWWDKTAGRPYLLGIELKSARGSLSPEQMAFRDALHDAGGIFHLCRSVDAVELVLKNCKAPMRGRAAA